MDVESMSIDDLWDKYITLCDLEARQQLILHHLPLVKHLAGGIAVKLPSFILQEDLESYGVIGLMEALDKYDPAKGHSFDSYAYYRIRGSILDEVRRQNWLPRTTWQKLQLLKKTSERWQREQGESISHEQLAKEMGLSIEEVHQIMVNANKMYLQSLDEEVSGYDGRLINRIELLEDSNSQDPLSIIEEQDIKRLLAEAVETLAEREKLILSLYYSEGLTLKEIGQILEVSESRVCQLHARVMKRLRQKLEVVLKS